MVNGQALGNIVAQRDLEVHRSLKVRYDGAEDDSHQSGK